MLRRALLLPAAALVIATLSGCVAETPGQLTRTPAPAASGDSAPGPSHPEGMPQCAEVTTAISGLEGTLAYDAGASEEQLVPEAYDQLVCVYVSADKQTQLGVTISQITFEQAEIDSYRSLPTVLVDDRASAIDAILQTSALEDGFSDHLDSTLLLYDTVYSIAIRGDSASASVETLPQLTVGAAADAAFAVRALLG